MRNGCRRIFPGRALATPGQSARRGVEREGSRHAARVYRARDGMRDDVRVVTDRQARAHVRWVRRSLGPVAAAADHPPFVPRRALRA